MYFDPHRHREITRQKSAETFRCSDLQRAETSSEPGLALRARISRALMKTAFAIDSDESWRHLWFQLSGKGSAVRDYSG